MKFEAVDAVSRSTVRSYMFDGMSSYVFKLYQPSGLASKVISRTSINAGERAAAIDQAKALWSKAKAEGAARFAMLFVKCGNVVWTSEPADAPDRPAVVIGNASMAAQIATGEIEERD